MNCLIEADKLKAKIQTLKSNYITDYAQMYQNNDLNNHLKSENDDFYMLFSDFNSQTLDKQDLILKVEIIKNFELKLVNDSVKMEIIANYMQKELNFIQEKQLQLDEEIVRYRVLNQFEKSLQAENRLIEKRKQSLQQQKSLFTKEIQVMQEYFKLNQKYPLKKYQEIQQFRLIILDITNSENQPYPNSPELTSLKNEVQNYNNMRSQMDNHLDGFDYSLMNSIDLQNSNTKNGQIQQNQTQIYARQQDLESLRTSLDQNSQDVINSKHKVDRQRNDIQNQNEDIIKQLIEENKYLIDQLNFVNAKLSPRDNYRQKSVANEDHYDENVDFQRQVFDMRGRFTMIKFLEVWIHRLIKKSRSKITAPKGIYFYLWRIKTLSHITQSQMVRANKHEIIDPVVEYKWQQTKSKWIQTKRYPLKNISKQRKEFEQALFDLERKRHWKQRFVSIFGSILKGQQRKVRLMKVVGFHKFLRNIALLSRGNISRNYKLSSFVDEQNLSAIASKRNTKEVIKPKETHQVRKLEPKKQANTKKSTTPQPREPVKQQDQHESGNHKKTSFDHQGDYNQAVRTLSQRVQKLSSIGKMVRIYQRKEQEDGQRLGIAFARWMRFNVNWENKALQEELASITFVLNERVFRENFLRTKLKLTKSEMDSKITLINELLLTILARSK